ncbi:MAG TPA: helix-turn-helix domain-containing protein [Vicinamibacterales bacterium]|nr:helix-turn-helix domain-containing protein [Vicinamibacterales bacterium]
MARHGEDSRGSPALIAERRAFGERLRRQRRHQNVSLTEVAASTKVGASHYAALERGDCSRWPGGVYNRAFIRAYAKAVGLDPDETAAEFAEYFESAPAPAEPGEVAGVQADGPSRPPLRLGIEPDPYEAEKRFIRIAALLIVDLLAIVALAATGMLFTTASFWICLACASIGYQMASRVVRSIPRATGTVKPAATTSAHVENPEPAQP